MPSLRDTVTPAHTCADPTESLHGTAKHPRTFHTIAHCTRHCVATRLHAVAKFPSRRPTQTDRDTQQQTFIDTHRWTETQSHSDTDRHRPKHTDRDTVTDRKKRAGAK
eukprot:2510546-Rhodomonas_salina.2